MQCKAALKSKKDSFAFIVKKGIRYILSRLIILIVAIRILDVSIDIDHLTAGSACVNVAGYDDTDSFSELFIETVTGDDHFVKENNTDDHSPFQKRAHKFHNFVFYSKQKQVCTSLLISRYARRLRPVIFNTPFPQEDFSSIPYAPPELAAFAIQLT